MSARAYEENLECYYNCAQEAMNELFEEDIDWYDEEDALKEERYLEEMWEKYVYSDVEMAEYIRTMNIPDKVIEEYIENRYLPCGYYIRYNDSRCENNVWDNTSYEYCGSCMMDDMGYY